MGERSYTVAEIDRMRVAVWRALRPSYPVTGGTSSGGQFGGVPASIVEDRLRTYMLGGIDPADLEAELCRRDEEA